MSRIRVVGFMRYGGVVLLSVIWLLSLAPAQAKEDVKTKTGQAVLSGGHFQYTVQRGDFLIKIGARFGVSARLIASDNGLRYEAYIYPGQQLWIDNRHIVPALLRTGNEPGAQVGVLYINLPQRMLYLLRDGQLQAAYPVGLGKPDWQTPSGCFKVTGKERDKEWRVPLSIQQEMAESGQEVKTLVPPGQDNPLGGYWLELSLPAIGIHGTTAPSSIYRFQSHGCIRLHPDDIAALFEQVEPGMGGEIFYAPLLLAEVDGRIYLEAHADIYDRGGVDFETLQRMATEQGLAARIDWQRAYDVLTAFEGVARDVSLSRD
jgi:L,D-transpeptidase ErfK/SrfK